MSLQKDLYSIGARNFLFIDVPPIHRSPVGKPSSPLTSSFRLSLCFSGLQLEMSPERYEKWNTVLSASIQEFSEKHTEATVLLFSAWDSFTRILDDPSKYGMDDEGVHVTGRKAWFDHLHPSTHLHKVLASDITNFLQSQAPFSSEERSTTS